MLSEVVGRPTNTKTIRTHDLICKGCVPLLRHAHFNEFEDSGVLQCRTKQNSPELVVCLYVGVDAAVYFYIPQKHISPSSFCLTWSHRVAYDKTLKTPTWMDSHKDGSNKPIHFKQTTPWLPHIKPHMQLRLSSVHQPSRASYRGFSLSTALKRKSSAYRIKI